MNLLELPDDILIQIFGELDLHSVLSLRKTCKASSSITRVRSIWYHFLQEQVVNEKIPVYLPRDTSISVLNSSELECCFYNSLQLNKNWTSPFPECTSSVTVDTGTDLSNNRIATIQFLPGLHHLITVSAADSDFLLQCWEIRDSTPICIATKWSPIFPRVLLNSDANHHATMAMTRFNKDTGDRETTLLHLDRTSGEFITLNEVPSYEESIALAGSYLISSDAARVLHIINITNGKLLANLHHPPQSDNRTDEFRCLKTYVGSDFIMTFTKLWIFLYHRPSSANQRDNDIVPDMEPVSTYRWQWRLDSIELTPSDPTRQPSPNIYPTPQIDLAIRFDSWFPWPVNVIYHYILPAPSGSGISPPISITGIPSPIRLFSPSDMIIGRYGTLMWIDGQVDDHWEGVASAHGQRIAGKILNAAAALDPRHLMRFEKSEDKDRWKCLAVDEERGRIAVGDVDGQLTILEYVP